MCIRTHWIDKRSQGHPPTRRVVFVLEFIYTFASHSNWQPLVDQCAQQHSHTHTHTYIRAKQTQLQLADFGVSGYRYSNLHKRNHIRTHTNTHSGGQTHGHAILMRALHTSHCGGGGIGVRSCDFFLSRIESASRADILLSCRRRSQCRT